jgi:AcrR family transcriptional regulator
MESKQARREYRIRRIFIDAAKEYIRSYGAARMTVKGIAELAGYSPGTLYNYFTDLQELLYACAADYLAECGERVRRTAETCDSPVERVVRPALSYARYFLDTPDAFHLIFLEELGERVEEGLRREEGQPEVLRLGRRHVVECAEAGIIGTEAVDTVLALTANTVHGNLLFFLSRRSPIGREELLEKIERELRYLFTGAQPAEGEGS